MNEDEAQRFARSWLDAWNAHDLEAVLAHFAEHVTFSSPMARRLVEGSDGVIVGKDALRAYWRRGLEAFPDLRFELVGLYLGIDEVVLNYRNQNGNLVSEVLRFVGGLVVEGFGTYAA